MSLQWNHSPAAKISQPGPPFAGLDNILVRIQKQSKEMSPGWRMVKPQERAEIRRYGQIRKVVYCVRHLTASHIRWQKIPGMYIITYLFREPPENKSYKCHL